MTPAEADLRIIQSRRTLAGWIAVGTRGEIDDIMQMVGKEMLILEALAEEHPGKVEKLVALASEWVEFQERLKKRLH